LKKRKIEPLSDEWSDQDIARGLGWLRILLGLMLFFMPRFSTRRWTGEEPEGAPTDLAVRGMGVRDVAIGAGIVTAIDRGAPVKGWLEASAMSDAGDALGTLFSWRGLGRPRGVMWFATEVASAALALTLADRLD
jgi:hypothetical protein